MSNNRLHTLLAAHTGSPPTSFETISSSGVLAHANLYNFIRLRFGTFQIDFLYFYFFCFLLLFKDLIECRLQLRYGSVVKHFPGQGEGGWKQKKKTFIEKSSKKSSKISSKHTTMTKRQKA